MMIPKWMKLMQCVCGHRVYSQDGTVQECPHCRNKINYSG
jgi:hypothetical protein